ncbi:MAG TPA: hypothetical protein VLV49_03155 [Terriglobales bacterium]|nr:hypothetical protein [Terriglobales bacterium]
MSTVMNNLDVLGLPVAETIQKRSFAVGAAFGVLAVIGSFVGLDQFYRSYLLAYMDWLGVTLGCLALLMLVHLTGGDWGHAIRRILEAGCRTLWLMIVLFVPIIFGRTRLYIWARPEAVAHDAQLQRITQLYLTHWGFLFRAAIYFVIWGLLVFFLTRWSDAQDSPPLRPRPGSLRALSAPGLILYGFTISFAAIDWVMSLDPRWISTIYGLIFVAGEALSALCFVVIVVAILVSYQPMSEYMRHKYVHDYGNLMLAFIMLWAYFSFSQWLIIWAGNLPDEISWYMARLSGGWAWIGLFLVLFHFAVPFAMLLSRSFKRKIGSLVWLASWVLFMRYVDLFWHIEPVFHPAFHVSWLDIVLPLAIGGLWLAVFFGNLKARPLLPLYDPQTQAVLEAAHES